MNAVERVARIADRCFDRLRDPGAFTITDETAIDVGFDVLRRHKYAVLVTYRRSGEPVPSPVWIAVDEDGNAYVKTADRTGKVRRLRHDNRVLVAPSNPRGKPLAPPIRGTGRVLREEEWDRAEATLAAAYGVGRRASERLLGTDGSAVYLAITPKARP